MDATSTTIVVEFGVQRNGVTFRLNPWTEVKLESWLAEHKPPSSVFLSFDHGRDWDFNRVLASSWMQIVTLLTSMSEDQIRDRGCRFTSPDNGVVFESLAA